MHKIDFDEQCENFSFFNLMEIYAGIEMTNVGPRIVVAFGASLH